MIHFGNDYHRSAHPRVLEAIAEADGAYAGYGADELCATAAERIRTACQAPNAEVHFMVGGTQANATIITHRLRPWEGVIAADSGHIATHETGAIEHTGHKVITLPNQLGKITAAQVRACMEEYRASGVEEHMPEPALVYITQPTEFGTAYSRANAQAQRIAEAFRTTGIDMLFDSPTNQQFALLTREQEEKLSQDFACQFFEEHEGLRVVRFCTAWSTEEGDVDKLCAAISALK